MRLAHQYADICDAYSRTNIFFPSPLPPVAGSRASFALIPAAIIIHDEVQRYYTRSSCVRACNASSRGDTRTYANQSSGARSRGTTSASEYVRMDLQTVTLVRGAINTNRVRGAPVPRVSHVTILHSASRDRTRNKTRPAVISRKNSSGADVRRTCMKIAGALTQNGSGNHLESVCTYAFMHVCTCTRTYVPATLIRRQKSRETKPKRQLVTDKIRNGKKRFKKGGMCTPCVPIFRSPNICEQFKI